MTAVNGSNFFKYITKDNGDSGNGSLNASQFAQQTWAAGGVFVDANSSDEQKIEAAATTLTSLLALFGKNESRAADEQTKANEEAANELDNAIKTTNDTINAQVNEQIARIQDIASKIQQNLEQVEEKNQQKEENQKKLEEHLATIDECKLILEEPNRTSAERTVAIEKLKTASNGIAEIAALTEKLQASTEKEGEEVANLGDEQTDVNTEVDTTIQDGNSQLAAAATQIITEQGKNIATAATGAVNETTSGAAIALAASTRAAAKATSWIPFGGQAASAAAEALAQKLDSVGQDQGQAGTTRLTNAAATQTKIAASEATRQASLTMFANIYSYAIGQSDEATLISNTFYSFMEPIGAYFENAESIDLESQSETLNEAIDVASQEVEEGPEEEKTQDGTKNNQENSDNDSKVELKFETDKLKELSA